MTRSGRGDSFGEPRNHIPARKVAKDANAWAERLRQQRQKPVQPAPVAIKKRGD